MKLLCVLLVACLIWHSCRKQINGRNLPVCETSNSSIKQKGPPAKPVPVCFYLDADGHGPYQPSNASPNDLEEVKAEIIRLYPLWEITVTTQESVYNQFSPGNRQRVVLTNSEIGFLGSSAIRSLPEANEDNPVLIWWAATRYYNRPNRTAARVAVHELGHSIGLYHQVDTCGQDYAPGDIYRAPIMGNCVVAAEVYFKNGLNTLCLTQKDEDQISAVIKRKRK